MALKLRKNRTPAPECPLASCMEFLRGAWTPEIIWYLMNGPRRFSELRHDIPAVSAKVLTARLRDLEARGVLVRTVQPTSPPSVDYALTPLGQEFGPVIAQIVAVGLRLKGHGAAAGGAAQPGVDGRAA